MSKLKHTRVARNAMNLDEQADMLEDDVRVLHDLEARLKARGYDLDELELDAPYNIALEE